MLAWDLALIDGKVLSPASYAKLTTPRVLTDGRLTNYGCGLGVQKTGDAVILSHGGGIAGVVTQNIVIPATAFLASVEQGKVDRSTLGDDFNALLTDEHLAKDRASLAAHGKVADVVVRQTVERGGMEVAIVEYKVGKTLARTAMYRSPDGKIQQFLINRQ